MDKPNLQLPEHPRLLFNKAGIMALKERIEKHDWAKDRWNGMKKNVDSILDKPVELPPRGGNWWHWYACPKHGAALRTGKEIGNLQWEHICPVDKEVLIGDPDHPERDYDGCVISGIHGRLSQWVLDLGIVYQVTGDIKYAQKARDILMAYVHRYLGYPLHTIRGEEKIGGGRVGPQTLDESTWLIPICQGADLVWDTLNENEKATIAQKMLLPAAKEVIMPHIMGVHNIQCWKNSAVGMVGFLLGETELIEQSINNPERGYWTQMKKGVLPDGIWWEGAWGYHFYTLSALWSLTEAANNCGINLYCEELKSMFDGPIRFAMPDFRLPAFNDSGEVGLKGRASIYELAYARYHDPQYALLLSTGSRNNDFALKFGADDLPSQMPSQWKSSNYPNSGYAILANGKGSEATWLCMKYGPHGGGHGHPDKLNFVLYSREKVIAPDPGTARYGVPIQGGWYRTTLAHNTLVVDENSQKPAEGKCLDFGSKDGVDFVMAEAGNIYDGVDFIRSVAMIEDEYLLFIDQVKCDRERLLDIAYHNRGKWDTITDMKAWIPPKKPGYEYLQDAKAIEITKGIDLFIEEDGKVALSLVTDKTTQIITAYGVGEHTADLVPTAIFRQKTKETAFLWSIGLRCNGLSIKPLSVFDADNRPIPMSLAAAVQVETKDGRKWIITANPGGIPLTVKQDDVTKYVVDKNFHVYQP